MHKRLKNKSQGAAILLGLCIALCGCGSANGTTSSPTNTASGSSALQHYDFSPTEDTVKCLGRTYFYKDMLWMVDSGTGAEFEFYGTKAQITLQGDTSALKNPANKDKLARVAIYVNGEKIVDEMMNEQLKTFDLVDAETPDNYTIRVIKLSEPAHSSLAIKNITLDAASASTPTAEKEMLIEFIGDSITCGYGVDDEVKEHHFSTTTEDVTKTYAYQTAELLDADFSIVSYSGYGIITGYVGSANQGRSESQKVPDYYETLGFSYGSLLGTSSKDISWDFTATRQPDVIVVNLGTNDYSYLQYHSDEKPDFVDSYTDFLEKIRSCNPDAVILCTLGIMGDELYPQIEEAVADFVSDTGDNNVYCMKFDVQSAADGYAADWHPTFATHKKAAEKLAAEIKKIGVQ